MIYDWSGAQYIESDVGPVSALPFSVSAWFKRPTGGAEITLWWTGVRTASSQFFGGRVNASGQAVMHARSSSPSIYDQKATANSVAVNTWAHAAWILTSSTDRRVLLNGGTAATTTALCTPATPWNRFSIGRFGSSSPSGNLTGGRVAHVAIWSVALSDDEARALAVGLDPTEIRPESIVRLWRLDAWAGGVTAVDELGNGNLTLSASMSAVADGAPLWDTSGMGGLAAVPAVRAARAMRLVDVIEKAATTAAPPPLGQWVQVSLVHDATAETVTIEVNGNTETVSAAGVEDAETGSLIVGGRLVNGAVQTDNDIYLGRVAEYGAALSGADLAAARLYAWRYIAPTVSPLSTILSASQYTVISLGDSLVDRSGGGLSLIGVDSVTVGTAVVEDEDGLRVRWTPPASPPPEGTAVTMTARIRVNVAQNLVVTLPITGIIATTGGTGGATHRARGVVAPRTAAVTNLIAPIRLSSTTLKSQANGGAVRSNGADFRVRTEVGADVPFAVDTWDPVTGDLVVKVRINVPAGQSVPLVVSWGEAEAPGYEDRAAVWEGWLAYWQLPAGDDVTGNNRGLTTLSGVTDQVGAVGRAGGFDASSDAQLANVEWLSGLTALTQIALIWNDDAASTNRGWFAVGASNPSGDTAAPLMARYKGTGDPGLGGARSNVVKTRLTTGVASGAIESTANQARAGAWSLVAMAWQLGLAPRLSVDGAEVFAGAAQTYSGSSTAVGPGPLYLGRAPGSADRWSGKIDEIGICATSLPPAWLAAAWDAARDLGGRFAGVGSVEVGGQVPSPIVLPRQISMVTGTTATIALSSLLHRPPGLDEAVTWSIPIAPTNGTAAVVGANITYTPDAGFLGEDSLSLRATGPHGLISTAKVWVTVAGESGGGGGVYIPTPGSVGYYPPLPSFPGATTYYVRPGSTIGLSTSSASPGSPQATLDSAGSGSTIIFMPGTYPALTLNRPGVDLYLRADRPVIAAIDTTRRTAVDTLAIADQVISGLQAAENRSKLGGGINVLAARDLVVDGFYGDYAQGKVRIRGARRVWIRRCWLRDANGELINLDRVTEYAVVNQCYLNGLAMTSADPASPYYYKLAGAASDPGTRAWTDYGIAIYITPKVYVVENLINGRFNHLISAKRFVQELYVDRNILGAYPNTPHVHAMVQMGQEQDYRFIGTGSSSYSLQDQTCGSAFVRQNTFQHPGGSAFCPMNCEGYEAIENYVLDMNYVVLSWVDGTPVFQETGPKVPGSILIADNYIKSGATKARFYTRGTAATATFRNNATPSGLNPIEVLAAPLSVSRFGASTGPRTQIVRVNGASSGFAAPVQL